MQENNISARRKRRKARTTDSNHSSPIAPNLLERDFESPAPNKKWVTDITFIATWEGWLYLAGVLDTYSRKIVGWAMGKHHNAELVKEALQLALLQRQPGADLVHHSDRGSKYASMGYQAILHQHNIQINMSKKGDCYDNSMMESFWGTLKEEGIGNVVFSTRKEAQTALFDYIEVFYVRYVQLKLI
jgi:putative transposase